MHPYTIDDRIDSALKDCVDVTIDFPAGKRWLFFITPAQLATCGDRVPGTEVPMHLGERHMIVVGSLTAEVIDAVLRQLDAAGELENRALPVGGDQRDLFL